MPLKKKTRFKGFKGKDHPLWGKHHSEESKKKMSLARMGKPDPKHTAAFKRKISAIMKNKVVSEETRRKIGVNTTAWLKEQWKKPEYRAAQVKRATETTTRLWKTPEYRAKVSAGQLAHSRGPYKESTLEYSVVNWARNRGMLVFKTDPGHCVGAPDRIFLIPGGKPFFIEFKRPDGKGQLGKLQIYTIERLRKAGYDVDVHNNREEAINAIKARL